MASILFMSGATTAQVLADSNVSPTYVLASFRGLIHSPYLHPFVHRTEKGTTLSEFIFMLSHHDRTVDNAGEVLEQVRSTGLRHIGFKDVGATPQKQRELTQAAHAAGLVVYLEVVS